MEHPRWDVADPRFLLTTFYVMAGLGIAVTVVGTLIAPRAFSGLLSGVILAWLLYLATMVGGRIAVYAKHFAPAMFWLFGAQVVLWLGMAVMLIVVKVDPIGFVIGVSVLPGTAVLVTCYWWLIRHKGKLP